LPSASPRHSSRFPVSNLSSPTSSFVTICVILSRSHVPTPTALYLSGSTTPNRTEPSPSPSLSCRQLDPFKLLATRYA
jgi:hypothetical protein